MDTKVDQVIELPIDRQPWLLHFALALSLCVAFRRLQAALGDTHTLGVMFLLAILLGLVLGWLMEPRKVLVSFESKKAIYIYSDLNPLRRRKEISLEPFSRIYEQPCRGGSSIHLCSRAGEELLLLKVYAGFHKPGTFTQRVESLRLQLAAGLKIADGGKM